jgi:hypothetical protein
MALLFKFTALMLVLFLGASIFYWVLLALHTQGFIQNEVSVIVLPLNAFFLNLILFCAFKKLGLSSSKTLFVWAFLLLCGGVFQLFLHTKWHVMALPAVATFPSIIAFWVTRRVCSQSRKEQ